MPDPNKLDNLEEKIFNLDNKILQIESEVPLNNKEKGDAIGLLNKYDTKRLSAAPTSNEIKNASFAERRVMEHANALITKRKTMMRYQSDEN